MITGPILRSLNWSAVVFLAILAAIAVLVPVLNLAVPASSPFHLPAYYVALFGKYLGFAILALSIDLIGAIAAFLRSAMPRSSRWVATRSACTDARDRRARRLRQSDASGLHGVPELDGAAGHWYGFDIFRTRR